MAQLIVAQGGKPRVILRYLGSRTRSCKVFAMLIMALGTGLFLIDENGQMHPPLDAGHWCTLTLSIIVALIVAVPRLLYIDSDRKLIHVRSVVFLVPCTVVQSPDNTVNVLRSGISNQYDIYVHYKRVFEVVGLERARSIAQEIADAIAPGKEIAWLHEPSAR
jgi:hypothetical protein